MKTATLINVLGLAGLVVSCPAPAVQRIEVKPDGAVTAKIASHETSRIKVDGAAIVDVYGSVLAPDNPAGELLASPDSASGEVYVIPSANAKPGKPINIFVKTAKATYTVLLTPLDVPSETVVLDDPTQGASADDRSAAGVAPEWERAIKIMVLAMRADRPPSGYMVTEVKQPVRLWQEARLLEVRRISNRGLEGAVYALTNVSDRPMVLDQREFFDRRVAAVAIDRLTLAPNESTQVYVIREQGHGER